MFQIETKYISDYFCYTASACRKYDFKFCCLVQVKLAHPLIAVQRWSPRWGVKSVTITATRTATGSANSTDAAGFKPHQFAIPDA